MKYSQFTISPKNCFAGILYFGNFVLQLLKVSSSVSKKKKHGPPIWLRTARKRIVENVAVDQIAGPGKVFFKKK